MTKKSNVIIALDCMGGDNAPGVIIDAITLIPNEPAELHFLLHGKKETIDFVKHKNVTIVDAQDVVLATDKPSVALRKRKSSMHGALNAVKEGKADCAISAGNTGALMAISRLVLGTLPGINRPAIVSSLPVTNNREMVFLDLGANVDCPAQILYEFALMGKAFAQALFGTENPSLALLNIGSEEVKGNEIIKETYKLIKNSPSNINFHGYIEADKMFDSSMDVVVTDGFCGNIMLKTSEGLVKTIKSSIKGSCSNPFFGMIKSVLLKYLLKEPFKRFNPKLRNGAMLIGLNGIVVKSHGNADKESFANAIRVAINAVRSKINDQIKNDCK